MSLPKDHMSFEKCIDIFESELGDHEPKEPYAGVHIAQAMRISIELLKSWNELQDDLKWALAGFYCAADDEWYGDGSAWDWVNETRILERNGFTKEDIIKVTPREWTT